MIVPGDAPSSPPRHAPAKLRPGSRALTGLLALLTAIGPLSIDLYVPALPDIGRALDASEAAAQLTVSIFIIGFAVGQLVHGPASDRAGRRPVLLAALAVFCLATLICAIAPTIDALVAARFVQGFGASGAIVLARAVIRDLYDGTRAARELSLMAMIMGLAPIVAPLVGGAMQTEFGWRADFVVILAAGATAMTLAWLLLPETRRRDAPPPHSLGEVLASFATIARDARFVFNIALVALSFSGLFAWISGSPFVLQNLYGLSPFSYGIAFAITGCGFILGTSLAARIVVRIGIDRTIGIGATLIAVAGVALVIAASALSPVGLTLAFPVALYLAGMGLVMPQAFAASLQPFPTHAGAASSLGGVIQQSAAAATGAAVGHALGATAWPLVLPIAAAAWLTLAVWFFTRGVRGTA
jgi:MFS transporter, DHA1 family, multidrug resistance protein